jgi:hypothetical protein
MMAKVLTSQMARGMKSEPPSYRAAAAIHAMTSDHPEKAWFPSVQAQPSHAMSTIRTRRPDAGGAFERILRAL